MGLFAISDSDKPSIEELVEANIALWKENKSLDYLLEVFAGQSLEHAAILVRYENDKSREDDQEFLKEYLADN